MVSELVEGHETLVECVAPACPKRVPVGRQACEGHWWSLPIALRERISTAWRVQNLDSHQRYVAEAADYLRELNPA